MLTPEYLQGMPDELVGIFEELEGDIIKDICRRIEKTAMITDTAEYEMLRLRELGAGEKHIEGLMKKALNASDDEVERMVFDAAQVSDEFYKKAYAAKGKGFTPYEYNDFTGQLVTAAVNQTRGELKNLTRSAGFAYDRHFNGVRKTYADTLDYAHMQVSTGATDYITAVRNATKKLTDSGLQFVDYESGVRNHCDVAVRRAVLTGVSQMAGEIAAHNMRELDTDIVEVSAHACARPEHALWQGRLYSYSGRDRRYPSLVAVTGYGTVTGLMGANCRHTFYPFIPGVSQRNYTEDELRSIDPPPFEYEGRTYTAYEASQKQRQIEREIRKTKREIIAAEATGDKDRLTVKAVRLRRQKELYHDFSKAAGLREQKERMQVNGYGRKTSMRTVWAEKKSLSESDVYYAKGNLNFGRIVGEKPPTKAMQKALDQEYEKFCAVFGDINTIRSIDIQAYKNDNVYGTFGKNDGILTLFGAGGDEGMAFLSSSAREHKRNGQWSTGSPMHAFRHELGHAWQQQLKTSDPQFDEKIERIKNKKAEFWERLTSSPNYDKLDIINAEQKKILSIYGLDREYDIDELISECAAEYVNGKPRDFAREVIEILKEK